MTKKNILELKETNIFLRYISIVILIVIFLSNAFLDFFIWLFTIISYYFLQLFIGVELIDLKLHLTNNYIFIVVKECIAPSAYILITLIFLTLPLKFSKIIKPYLYSILIFSLFNLIRILFLMWVHITFGAEYFDKYHLIFYQGLSGIVVALIVIYYLRKNKIKKVYPVYSDLKYLTENIKFNKKIRN